MDCMVVQVVWRDAKLENILMRSESTSLCLVSAPILMNCK
jgi:hypothetical protein